MVTFGGTPARSLGMSYRRAWLLVDSLNSYFREPVSVRPGVGQANRRLPKAAAVNSLRMIPED